MTVEAPSPDSVGEVSASELRRLLYDVARGVESAMLLHLEPAGLSPEEWAVISLLADGKGHTMTEVMAAAGVPAASATRLVDRLVSRALLHRAVDDADRRRVLVVLSPRGVELHDRLAPAQRAISELLISRVGVGELAGLVSRLSSAREALRSL